MCLEITVKKKKQNWQLEGLFGLSSAYTSNWPDMQALDLFVVCLVAISVLLCFIPCLFSIDTSTELERQLQIVLQYHFYGSLCVPVELSLYFTTFLKGYPQV